MANVVYGVGVDGLYNFLERGAYTQGVFLGLILAGSTWNGGDSLIACIQSNACKISAKTTYFQLPLKLMRSTSTPCTATTTPSQPVNIHATITAC
ncbi:outer membrane beta-barrel protein [Helicobacter felis]|uniref:outer membrane beta-barrel protein n=1 Tax=Helicobacter felis TaxID=214 RepID=UPI001F345F29|nr:outer membrane beta-barrel protein [Helicobacter felis]